MQNTKIKCAKTQNLKPKPKWGKNKTQNPKTLRAYWSRALPWPGTYEPLPPSPSGEATWTHHRSRAGSRPGLMTSVISPEAVVPGAQPGTYGHLGPGPMARFLLV